MPITHPLLLRSRILLSLCLVFAASFTPRAGRAAEGTVSEVKSDLIVFGGTSAGIMSAVAAGRPGTKVKHFIILRIQEFKISCEWSYREPAHGSTICGRQNLRH